MALFSRTQDVNRLTRAAVAWWGVGQLLVLAAYLAAATRGMPAWAIINAVVAGTTISRSQSAPPSRPSAERPGVSA